MEPIPCQASHTEIEDARHELIWTPGLERTQAELASRMAMGHFLSMSQRGNGLWDHYM